jgi:hypothetical protein
MEYKKLVFKNSNGFMMVEVLIALAILAGSAVILHGAVGYMNKEIYKIKLNRQSKEVVTGMINTLTNSGSILQVDYSNSQTFPTDLPIAWDNNGGKKLVKDCGNPCALEGRMGVIITPTDNKKVYLMRIRLTHPTWTSARVSSFLVGAE